MFAPVVMPFQITAAIFAIVLVAVCLYFRHPKAVVLSILAAMILFIPSCTGVMLVVDLFRYGRFDYASATDIPDDGYIDIPSTAANIVLYRNGAGHWARFTVATDDLLRWIAEMRSLRPDLNDTSEHDDRLADGLAHLPESVRTETLELKSQMFADRFPDTGWEYDPAMNEYRVWRSDRGGGYTIWHIPDSDVAYLSAGYW